MFPFSCPRRFVTKAHFLVSCSQATLIVRNVKNYRKKERQSCDHKKTRIFYGSSTLTEVQKNYYGQQRLNLNFYPNLILKSNHRSLILTHRGTCPVHHLEVLLSLFKDLLPSYTTTHNLYRLCEGIQFVRKRKKTQNLLGELF